MESVTSRGVEDHRAPAWGTVGNPPVLNMHPCSLHPIPWEAGVKQNCRTKLNPCGSLPTCTARDEQEAAFAYHATLSRVGGLGGHDVTVLPFLSFQAVSPCHAPGLGAYHKVKLGANPLAPSAAATCINYMKATRHSSDPNALTARANAAPALRRCSRCCDVRECRR